MIICIIEGWRNNGVTEVIRWVHEKWIEYISLIASIEIRVRLRNDIVGVCFRYIG